MRLDENGANTPELSDAPPEVATLGRNVAGTQLQLKGPPRRPDVTGIPTLRTFPPPGSHSPGPRGAEKLTLIALTCAHRRAHRPAGRATDAAKRFRRPPMTRVAKVPRCLPDPALPEHRGPLPDRDAHEDPGTPGIRT
ncbi:hypothetical protein A6R68_19265 [Neotoma lepida]|uniref:Uncharacterized protein n=1 Tax=Neotoma lepida TaxID=56216 RepID=A0A1A6HJG0_NEOLE|nr:hypothetical protein A6R68_19265 [Neotoma lepida]